MGIVAVGAGHQAFLHRHVRRKVYLHLLVEMALEADLRFRPCHDIGSHPVGAQRRLSDLRIGLLRDRHRAHRLMTVGAPNTPEGVRTSLPEGSLAVLMALQASIVLKFDVDDLRAREAHESRRWLMRMADVLASGTMTGLTSERFDVVARTGSQNVPHNRLLEILALDFVAFCASGVVNIAGRKFGRR